MLLRCGTDLCALSRFTRPTEDLEALARRILTDREFSLYQSFKPRRQITFLAGRFAVKEAFAKALGCGISPGFSWQDLTVLPNAQGRPTLSYTDALCEKHPFLKTAQVDCSISHDADLILAFCVILGHEHEG